MKNDFVLRNKKDFKNLFNNRTCYYSSFFTFFVVKNKVKHLRTAIAVNKKNEKTAVKRNKIKRQIRAMLRENTLINIPFDILIIPKKSFLEQNFDAKKHDLLTSISKLSIKFNSYNNKNKNKVGGKNNGQ